MSLFITFEGIEGAGKTTQIHRLADTLQSAGHAVAITREPGGCPIADAIRGILLDPASAALVPRAELLLYAAARAQHVDEIIQPALQAGRIVLCDRFIDATVAYQGNGRGLDSELIAGLNRVATGGLIPDLTLLFDLSVSVGLERACRRNAIQGLQSEERFEQEALSFHSRVREGYRQLAQRERRFRLVDANGSETEIAERVLTVVREFLMQGVGQ